MSDLNDDFDADELMELADIERKGRRESANDPSVTITMPRSQWVSLYHAAGSYDVRIPREQGDGGVCLDALAEAIVASRWPLVEDRRP